MAQSRPLWQEEEQNTFGLDPAALGAQLPMPLPAVFCSFRVEQRGAPGAGPAGTSLGSCLCLGLVAL